MTIYYEYLGSFLFTENYFKVCDRNALDVNDCLADAIQKGIASMVDGIPDLNVPPIDPYLQKDFKLDYKNNQVCPYLLTRQKLR